MNDSLVIVSDQGEDSVNRIESTDVLAPGYYWRVKNDLTKKDERKFGSGVSLRANDVHLLLDVFEFEGRVHSVEILCHPRDGSGTTHRLMVDEFFQNMEPAYDAEDVRAREQARIMQRVQDIQTEMADAQVNPLALPGVQEAAENAVQKFEQEMMAEASSSEKSEEQRQNDLRRIHRRATRRSTKAGNPLVPRTQAVSNDLAEMIAGGVTSEGLSELTLEARRRTAIAEATSTWLTERSRNMVRTLESLAPFYAERGRVAIARAKKAISYAKEITSGLRSLKLYTGDGVDVVTLCEGRSAATSEPLTLVQAKRYMDEELAVYADVSEEFDWSSQTWFFDELAKNAALRDQIMPAERCVVTMAVRRRSKEYSNTSAYEAMMYNVRNKLVFLLVRDGENLHVVYSAEPSHEAADRLFPTAEDIEKPFRGLDGSKIRMDEVAFVDAASNFEDMALHYKRFLILLCGLDHRIKLMGDFYPPERAMEFMSLSFQERYFRFLQDDDDRLAIGDQLEPVGDFVARCNKALRSGSRVVATGAADAHSPALKRQHSLLLDKKRLPTHFIVGRDGKRHYISLPVRGRYSPGDISSAKAWLDDEAGEIGDWFLCLDRVRLDQLRRYVYSRASRSSSIGWIRAFKRGIAAMEADLLEQAELRAHLRKTGVEYGGIDSEQVEEAMESAISTWRAAHRGENAPGLADTKAVNEILTMMYPVDRLAITLDDQVTELVREQGWKPLLLARTGKTRLALYVIASEEDREPYAPAVQWGWVKRVVLEPRRSKLAVGSTSLVWLRLDRPNAAEEEIRRWEGLQDWIHEGDEPARLKDLEAAKAAISASAEYAELLRVGRGAAQATELPETLFGQICSETRKVMGTLRFYDEPTLWLLIGAYQPKEEGTVKYIYAVASVPAFVRHYGNDEQLAELLRNYTGFRSNQNVLASAKKTKMVWRLSESGELLRDLVTVKTYIRTPSFATAEVFINTKGQAKFKHRHEDRVLLSWGHSVDVLMGASPYPRRRFHKELCESMAREKRMPDFGGERAKKLKELASRRYQPQTTVAYVSPLLWDAGRGRSMANQYFSVTDPLSHEQE